MTPHPSIVEVTEWHLDNCFYCYKVQIRTPWFLSEKGHALCGAEHNQSSFSFSITSPTMSPLWMCLLHIILSRVPPKKEPVIWTFMHKAHTVFALKALSFFHGTEGDTAPHELRGLFELFHCRSPSALFLKSLFDLTAQVYFLPPNIFSLPFFSLYCALYNC